MKTMWRWCAAGTLTTGLILAGCGGQNSETSSDGGGDGGGKTTQSGGTTDTNLKGQIRVDGSSTVGPITSAVAEEFGQKHPRVRATVGISGTGGGFTKFAAGGLEIADASRPIKDKEAKAAEAKGIKYIELPVAYDGLAVIANPKNTWADSLTVAELKKIWEKGSKINNWSQIRQGFPNRPLKLYGPGTSSGTFDYFVEEILGKEGKCRSDFTASEDDNTLVEGVSRDVGALGYFGHSYYEQNKDKLKLLGVDAGKGAIKPTTETIVSGKYSPLSRPLFIYVSDKAADRPEVQEFIKFYLTDGKALITDVGYVPLPDSVYEAAIKRFEARTMGSAYADKSVEGKTLEQVYGASASAMSKSPS